MIFDLHNDYPTSLKPRKYARYINVVTDTATVCAAIWTSDFGKTALITTEKLYSRLPDTALKAIEDIGFLARDNAFESFDFSRFVYCSLTWNFDNEFAGGALDSGTLTEKGKAAVAAIERCGCAIDVAHLNRKSLFAVLDTAKRPICTHTGFTDHARCLDDDSIRALIARHAPIGLSVVSKFSGAKNAAEFETVIDEFVQKYGANYLALGTDFFGSKDIPPELDDYHKLQSISVGLTKRGYTQDVISDIFYNNAKRFFNGEQ